MLQISKKELLRENERLRARLRAMEGSSVEPGSDVPAARELLDFFDQAPDMFFIVDASTGRVLHCNRAVVRRLGYEDRDDVIGRRLFELVHPDFESRARDLLGEFRRTGHFRDVEVVYRDRNGNRIFGRCNASAVRDADGNVLYSRSVVRDVTDMHRVERALEEANRELRGVLASVSDYLWSAEIHRGEWRYRYYSPVVEKITGRPPEFYLPDPDRWLSTIHPDDRSRVRTASHLLEDVSVDEFAEEHRIVRPDGEVRWVRDAVRVDRSDPARVLVNGVVTDITEIREASEELERKRTELAHLTRLGMLGEMVAGLAHELTQPLSAIANDAGACVHYARALDDERGSRLLESLRRIEEQAERTREIIRSLRRFSRKGDVELAEFRLHEVVRDTLRLVAAEIRGNDVHVDLDLDPSVDGVWADRVQVQQVLVNLLRNACEAMLESPRGERRIVVGTRSIGETIEVRVADRGPGIPEEVGDRIFDPFFTTKSEGLGVGLSISRSIVEAHGGRLRVRSNPDQGTTFTFCFPRTRGDDDSRT